MLPPASEAALLARCHELAGLTFLQLSARVNLSIPPSPIHRKGFLGMAMERALGADGGSLALPDFQALGIELKTLPLNKQLKPAESTFVTTIPLLTIHQESWETSICYSKLKRVLWVPIEGDTDIPYTDRRIGQPFIWSPEGEVLKTLKADWQELTNMIVQGQLESITATLGQYLQIRPKAQNGQSLCEAYGPEGEKIKTLPRGFYLRAGFTSTLL